jgi:amino acid transporter
MDAAKAQESSLTAHELASFDGIEDEGRYNDVGTYDKGYTSKDQQDMQRMGKRQELIRNFRPLSALAFTALLQATWEFLLIANTQVLVCGGLAGFFWTYIWTFIGFGIVMTSLAEMASMCPTSGGQYHWVSEFAPPEYQKGLSYLTGWMSTLSWQAGTASGSFLTGTIIQALIQINNPDYDPTAWQGTLLVFAMVLVLWVANTWGARDLPLIQNVLLIVHVFAFLAVIIVLWVMAPRNSAKVAFTQFTQEGGWSSMGLALMVGQISAIYGSLCSDCTAHMAEEVTDAGRNVPNAMFWAYVSNGILGFILIITYNFTMTDVDAALNDPTEYPFIWLFRQAVSTGGVNALTIIILILVIASNISFNASTSRQTFAFARDKGLPFSSWIGKVHPTLHIPANAVALTCICSCLLALINIGSSTAFNAIISLQVCALMFSYTISISCVLFRRLYHPELLPQARWSLGKWGIPINAIGILYSIFAFFWSFWPNQTPVDAESFNWAIVLFAGTMIICGTMYFVHDRKVYTGPVVDVSRN